MKILFTGFSLILIKYFAVFAGFVAKWKILYTLHSDCCAVAINNRAEPATQLSPHEAGCGANSRANTKYGSKIEGAGPIKMWNKYS